MTALSWKGAPTHGEPEDVLRALGAATERYHLELGERHVTTVTYLDTVDHRLWRHKLVMRHERSTGPGDLVLSNGSESTRRTALTGKPRWPARAEQLPPGDVRERAADAMWVRAVAPVVEAELVVCELRVCNEDAKTVARIEWAEAEVETNSAAVVRVSVQALRGYEPDAQRVVAALLADGEFEIVADSLHDTLVAATEVADAPPAAITADLPAQRAVAGALLEFADAIEANVDGTIRDVDVEFLHDLRVAVRRSRSLLKLTGDILPGEMALRYGPELKWLGDLTTPTRDLDVYLLEFADLAAELASGDPADLAPFETHLRVRRVAEQKALVNGLRGKRFRDFLASWRTELAAVAADPAAAPTVGELAAERLERAAHKVAKREKVIAADSPDDDVHALRKRCKELRYLLEVFAPVCAPKPRKVVVKELKKIQDSLGRFQDGHVQNQALHIHAEEMLTEGQASARVLLAMGELAGRMERMQRDAKQDLISELHTFTGADLRKRVRELVK